MDGEVLNVFETDRLVDFCVDLAVRRIGVAFDFEIARGECGDGTSDGAEESVTRFLLTEGVGALPMVFSVTAPVTCGES
jgi:hypothetical protein